MVLEGVRPIMFFQDNVLVYGKDKTDHDNVLVEVLTKLNQSGLTVKRGGSVGSW